jgi:hypothetical protein
MNEAAALSPYVIPRASRKVVNVGDGFILRSIERLIGPFAAARVFTTRAAPDGAQFTEMENANALIVAGANQLTDTYSIWPGLTADTLNSSRLKVIPFGVGLHGDPAQNRRLSANTREILEIVHHRIPFSSWRCPRTIAILKRDLPHLADRFLMTGCPVIFDRPLLDMPRFSDREGAIAVTVTDRGAFWEREAPLLEHVAALFPRVKRTMVLHQNFRPETRVERVIGALPLSRLLRPQVQLRQLARKLGFQVAAPSTAETAMDLYRGIDLHIGTRLHAHLHFLSQNKRSYLIPVDERSLGFSEAFGFPLGGPDEIDLQFDFERVRTNARAVFETMSVFLRSLSTGS